jgi:hypothetical protein
VEDTKIDRPAKDHGEVFDLIPFERGLSAWGKGQIGSKA